VTHSSKKAIEDHFDVNSSWKPKLETPWPRKSCWKFCAITAPPGLKVTAVRQGKALVWGMRCIVRWPIVGDAAFACPAAPDVLVEQSGAVVDLRQMD